MSSKPHSHPSFAAVPGFAILSWSGAHALAVNEPQKRKDQAPPLGEFVERSLRWA